MTSVILAACISAASPPAATPPARPTTVTAWRESRREGGRVRQVALLNLGRHFDLPEAVETHAQAIAARLVTRAPIAAGTVEFAEVDVASLELVQPRAVGVEHVALHALAQLEFEHLLASLGVNAITRAMMVA